MLLLPYPHTTIFPHRLRRRRRRRRRVPSLQYTFYSIPNTVLPFIGGMLADKYGFTTAPLSVAPSSLFALN